MGSPFASSVLSDFHRGQRNEKAVDFIWPAPALKCIPLRPKVTLSGRCGDPLKNRILIHGASPPFEGVPRSVQPHAVWV